MRKVSFLAGLLMVLTLSACDDPKNALRVLEDAGYTNIQVGGYAFFMCGKDDSFATKFTADNPRGRKVSGAVCTSWFVKGGTVRF